MATTTKKRTKPRKKYVFVCLYECRYGYSGLLDSVHVRAVFKSERKATSYCEKQQCYYHKMELK